MEYESFDQALQICMTAENGSAEQTEALQYCLKTAPRDLREMLVKRLGLDQGHNHQCGCGCGKKES